MVDNEYFITEDNKGMLKQAKEANTILVHITSISHTHFIIFINNFFKITYSKLTFIIFIL